MRLNSWLTRKVYELQPQIIIEESYLITKILVGVDGSENSEKAMDYALEVADKFSASMLIINVFRPPPEFEYQPNTSQQFPSSGSPQEQMGNPSNVASFIKNLRQVHEEVLSRSIERAIKLKPNIKITAELKEGDVASQIVETAANGQFDLIVLGHRGDSRIKELFLGSTSEKVVHTAKCPVLITN
jgi:nucleotide-binding universal stress UspA family protein